MVSGYYVLGNLLVQSVSVKSCSQSVTTTCISLLLCVTLSVSQPLVVDIDLSPH